MPSPKLVLIRHAPTSFNEPDPKKQRIRGWLDIPAEERGLYRFGRQAEQLLKKVRVAAIYASDMTRTQETAQVLHEQSPNEPPIILHQGLRPWNNGVLQGARVSDASAVLVQYEKNLDSSIPGGESFSDFSNRYLTELRWLLGECGVTRNQGAVVGVTHSRNCDLAIAWHVAGMRNAYDEAEMRKADQIPPGGSLCFEWDGKRWILIVPFTDGVK